MELDLYNINTVIVLVAIGLIGWSIGAYCKKKENLKYISALFICISLIVFLGTTASMYWKASDFNSFWTVATAGFTFFGVLLTTGAAFAAVAAVVSYFSVTEKLKLAEKEINDLNTKKEEFNTAKEQLDTTKNELDTVKSSFDKKIKTLNQKVDSNFIGLQGEFIKKSNELDNLINGKKADFENYLNNQKVNIEDIAKKEILTITEKLKDFQEEINKKDSLLKKFERLENKRRKLEEEINKLDEYKIIVQHMEKYDPMNGNNGISLDAANKILKNSQANFEARLKARAIVQDDKIYREFEQVRAEPSEEAWQQVIAIRQENLAIWKLLFQAASEAGDAYSKAQNNYAVALFNYGVALSFYGNYLRKQGETDKAISQWQQAGQQYALLVKIKPDKYEVAYYNWGNALFEEAKVLFRKIEASYQNIEEMFRNVPINKEMIEKNSIVQKEIITSWEKVKKLYYEAEKKFKKALEIKTDDKPTADIWWDSFTKRFANIDTIYNENSRTLFKLLESNAEQEKRKLLKEAQSQVLELQNHSPEHQQSEVIQDLLDKIDAEINKLSP